MVKYSHLVGHCQFKGERVEDHDAHVAGYTLARSRWRLLVVPPHHQPTRRPGPARQPPSVAPIMLCDRHALALKATPFGSDRPSGEAAAPHRT